MTIKVINKATDPTDDLTNDEWDGTLITEWLESFRAFPDFTGPPPASARYTEGTDLAHQNAYAWDFVTLPSGLSRVDAVKLMAQHVLLRYNVNHDKKGKFAPKAGGGGGLKAEQYAAMAPTEYSKEHRDALISKLEETKEGKLLAHTMVHFQEHEYVVPFRGDVESVLNGQKLPSGREERAKVFLDSVKHAPSSMAPDTLYRGMTLKEPPPVVGMYVPGSTHNFAVASFSSSRDVSESYQRMTSDRGNTQVMVELTGKKQALPIQNLSKNASLYAEQEWVSSGKFKVEGVSQVGSQVTVHMVQEGTLG